MLQNLYKNSWIAGLQYFYTIWFRIRSSVQNSKRNVENLDDMLKQSKDYVKVIGKLT